MNRFLISETSLIKIAVMTILSVIIFGLAGLLGMMLMHWMIRQNYAEDGANKHGIAKVQASRLGGAFIIGSSFLLLMIEAVSGNIVSEVGPWGIRWAGWVGCILCAVLGLLEDIENDILKPRYRLLSKVVIFALVLWLWPELVPANLNIAVLDLLLSYPPVAWFLTIIFCVGFLNASNMADGANGLMPTVFFICFLIFSLESDLLVYSILTTTTGIFVLFNVISGRMFLGDAGSYGLGAVVAIAGLEFYSGNTFSASFLAVLLAYPCIEILVSMLRRGLSGRSVLLPDNDHFHNRLHSHLARRLQSQTMANSLTGLIIAAGSSGFALAGYLAGWSLVLDALWLKVFAVQCLLYAAAFYCAGINRHSDSKVTG